MKSVVLMVLGFTVPVQPNLQPSGRGDPASTGKSIDFRDAAAIVEWVIVAVVKFCLTIYKVCMYNSPLRLLA